MVTPIRRSRIATTRPANRRPAFSMRQLTFSFGIVVIGVIGVGLLIRKAVEGSGVRPGAVVLIGVVAVATAVAYVRLKGRGRSAPNSATTSVVGRPVEPVDPAASGAPGDSVEPAEPGDSAEPIDEVPAQAVEIEDYASMDADQFENAVARLCERAGCADVSVVGGANDLGADVLATAPDGRVLVIQCKRYNDDNKVGSQDVQRFGGTCFAVHQAEIAVVITTSAFTEPAAEYADQCGILCFDNDDLIAWAAGLGPAPWQ
ncbi:restriction endonuclease [Streptomyces sp. NPDC017993]|uniref:restriction endonuclease n=1 Tax=Streptomyces sp. NPDC017993 TaxID=3365027 RepID=UPI00378A756D